MNETQKRHLLKCPWALVRSFSMKSLTLSFSLLLALPVVAQNLATVQVVDEANAPVVGAQIEVQAQNEAIRWLPVLVTDAKGHATLPLPEKPDGKSVISRVLIAAKGFGFSRALVDDKNSVIRLKKGVTWQGRVVDEAGKPIEGATINIVAATPNDDTSTYSTVWLTGRTIPNLYTKKSGADGSF